MSQNRITVPESPVGRLSPAWRECVGTGRFALGLRKDYLESLAVAQREIGFRLIRGHGVLSDDVGIHRPYEHQGQRQVRYAFTYLDQIVDAYLALGIRPFLELGFMPSGLVSADATVFWWKGNITPPSSPDEWARLTRATVAHLVDRYGLDEVRGWPIEVWNEPNLEQFWLGADQDAYHRLYETTAGAVKDVDSSLQVGGPAISPGGDEFLDRFAEFVLARSVPLDFISRHAYTSGPAQHVPFGVHQTLRPAADLLAQFARPRQQLAGTPLATLPVHITEFNSSYRPDNPIHDTAFHAAYLAPVLAAGGELVDSFAYWTFSDVFEEVGIPTALFHGGFGLLTHRQIPKPAYHLYAFFARLGPQILARGGDHLVTRHPDGRLAVLAWAPVDVSGVDHVDAHVLRLDLPCAGSAAFVLRSRVNEQAGNAATAWAEMGRPRSPKPRELDALREAAQPVREHRRAAVAAGRLMLDLTLARHEVTLVEASPVADETPPWWDEGRLLGRGATAVGEASG
ncbi:MAG TPA: xylan 1,4-beta-xylosidase [Micromonosporaceae bacterium]|jgi:xylan 1,4-beta-xylosidase